MAFPPLSASREEAYVAKYQIGIQVPIVVTRKREVVDGVRRWLGALHWRLESVPCVELSGDFIPAEIAAMAIFLNDHQRACAKAVEDLAAPYRISLEFDCIQKTVTTTKKRLWLRAVEYGMINKIGGQVKSALEAEFADVCGKMLNAHLSLEDLCFRMEMAPDPMSEALLHSGKAMSEMSRMFCSFSENLFRKIDEAATEEQTFSCRSLIEES